MESLYGCAKECPVGLSDLPCSGRGTCEFDSSTYAISCDCSNGASGDACEVDPLFGGSSSAFRNQARNWFLGIAIVALCTAAAALVRVIFLCPQSKWYSGSAISVLSFTLLISAQVWRKKRAKRGREQLYDKLSSAGAGVMEKIRAHPPTESDPLVSDSSSLDPDAAFAPL